MNKSFLIGRRSGLPPMIYRAAEVVVNSAVMFVVKSLEYLDDNVVTVL